MARRAKPLSSGKTGVFPVTHSVLSAAALIAEVLPDYDIGTPIECRLLDRSLNDTYLVKTSDDRYILRAYRAGWRSPADIGYEFDVLFHLAGKGVPVSMPIARKDGRHLRTLHAPEGDRPVVLFTYANGEEASPSEEQSYRYGQAVATLHTATGDFRSTHDRFHLDLRHLLDQPLAAIRPFLAHRPDDWTYLQQLGGRLRDHLAHLAEQLDYGFCHGDTHGGNAHMAEHQTITFFDFDCCGPGWRVYDLAVFRWGRFGRDNALLWKAFLKGYQQQRSLSAIDLAAIPWFVALRHIWLLGLHTGNARDWGSGWLNDDYFDHGGAGGLEFLREWEAEHLKA